jgi:hypothetical protein
MKDVYLANFSRNFISVSDLAIMGPGGQTIENSFMPLKEM